MQKRYCWARTTGLLVGPLLALTVCSVGVAAAQSRTKGLPVRGKHLVFDDEFQQLRIGPGETWGWQTGAYAKCDSNRGNHKLDLLTRDALSVRDGVLTITARRRSGGLWSTGLLTTGDSCGTGGGGFTERTGDVVVAHIRLPGPAGGWPAIWSWRDGENEVDLFEWHGPRPGQLEFINHVRESGNHWKSPLVNASGWLYIGVHLGATNNTWYVGATRAGMRAVWSDGHGVGSDFASHPVINLSIDDGVWTRSPARDAVLRFQVGSFKVYR